MRRPRGPARQRSDVLTPHTMTCGHFSLRGGKLTPRPGCYRISALTVKQNRDKTSWDGEGGGSDVPGQERDRTGDHLGAGPCVASVTSDKPPISLSTRRGPDGLRGTHPHSMGKNPRTQSSFEVVVSVVTATVVGLRLQSAVAVTSYCCNCGRGCGWLWQQLPGMKYAHESNSGS